MPKMIQITAKIKAPKKDSYPAKVLEQGIKIEMEHTTSKRLAALIAKNHLDEDINYYKKLRGVEK